MGSFNVACSISNLSISSGTRVAFIPLLPNTYKPDEPHYVGRQSKFLYPNDFFNPFSLPIFGRYNDYGDLTEIEVDSNTLAIEEFTGIPIQDFVSIINCPRGMFETMGKAFKKFALHSELISSYSVELSEDFLLKIGFSKNDKGSYQFNDIPFLVRLTENESKEMGYEILNTEGEKLKDEFGYDVKKKFLVDYYRVSDYFLHISKENQRKVRLFYRLSGMFVHGEIYDELAKGGSPTSDKDYDSLQKEIKDYQEKKDKEEEGSLGRDWDDPFGFFKSHTVKFFSFYKDWKYFQKIYRKPLEQGLLKDLCSNYYAFYWKMYSCNRFFFPAMNGEQCGNPAASKQLLEKSLEIVNRELAEMEEDYEE